MTITVVGIVTMYGLVLFRTRKDASVLTSGIAAIYILYLQWSALSANPNVDENLQKGKFANDTMQITLGMVFTLTALFIISASTTSGDSAAGEGVSAHLMEKKEDLGYDPVQAGTKDPKY